MSNEGKSTKNEILQQPQVWKSTLERMKELKDGLERSFLEDGTKKAVFYGCGSSYYSALSASQVFQHHSVTESLSLPSSELLLFPEISFTGRKNRDTILVPISRSGNTTETVRATKLAVEDYDSQVFGLTCHSDSSISNLSDFTISLKEAGEESVVQTKSFTSMLLALIATALSCSENDGSLRVTDLPETGERVIKDSFSLVEKIFNEGEFDDFVFLGAGPIYGAAMESMLKMKEMAIENTEGYPPLEYRHGPKSTITERTLITLYASDTGREYEEDLVEELKEYEGTVVVLSENGVDADPDYEMKINSGLDEFTRIPLYVIFAQIMGLKRALDKGINPDNPRRLDGVVELDN